MAASRLPDVPRGGPRPGAPLEQPRPEGLTQRALLHILETFFRRPLVYLLPLVLFLGLGVYTALNAEDEYRSTGVLSVSTGSLLEELNVSRGFGYERPSAVTARNLNNLIGTGGFMDTVIEEAGLTDEVEQGFLRYDDARASLRARAHGDSLVAVSSTTPVPEWSQALASATLRAFREYTVANDIADATVRIRTYEQLRDRARENLERAEETLTDYLRANPVQTEAERPVDQRIVIARMENDIERAEAELRAAEANVTDAQLAADVARTVVERQLRIIDEPLLPNAPVSGMREMVITVAIFLVLGLLLSAAFLVLASIVDRSIRTVGDVKARFGVDVIGVVPNARRA